MAPVRVKICGVTNLADARAAVKAGADYLGFNFWPRSPRYIKPAKAQRIVRQLPKSVVAVGVFVNEPEENILAIARSVGLAYVQLHGDETPQAVGRIGRIFPVIKAVRVRESFRPATLKRFRGAKAILLDGFDRKLPGGTGKTFDWTGARGAKRYAKIFLAGGLKPENVAEAIRVVSPFAVDTASGVESRPGKKSSNRVKAFVRNAKGLQKAKK